MNIYKLSRQTTDYDQYGGFVIAARLPSDARMIAANNCADEGPNVWLSANDSKCDLCGMTSYRHDTAHIILSDFRAG
jgi:hypothetical protein